MPTTTRTRPGLLRPGAGRSELDAPIGILETIGGLLLVVGVILWVLGATGRAIGGRKHYYEPRSRRRSKGGSGRALGWL